MSKPLPVSYQQEVVEAFNKQSIVFDEIYSGNAIIQYKRKRVRDHVLKYLEPNSRILELNAGTGEDAVYFAEQDHSVHATDISPGMQEQLIKKVNERQLQHLITNEICSFTSLANLQSREPYDLIFSNFAGLNCTGELDKVLGSFSSLLKPGGIVTLVILPKFCLWETLLLFKGKFKTAFRRFFSKNGKRAHLEGSYFRCWYYDPSFIKKHLEKEYEVQSIEGLCSLVPPSYIENFAEKHPWLFQFLKNKENKWKTKWPWKSTGDYYIISLKKLR
jgi:ubiquinone/menaquinone biosynthesis C-methylase UbiE